MESKLKKVVKDYEETVKLMVKISLNEKISVDDRNLIDGVKQELRRIISTAKKQHLKEKECDSMINDYRLMAEKELSEICNKVSNLTIKETCLRQISLFTTADDDQLPNQHIKHFTTAFASDDDDDYDDDDDDDQLPNKDIKHFTTASASDDDDDDDDDQLPNKHIKNNIFPYNNERIISRRNKRKTKQPQTDEKNISYSSKRAELDAIATLTRLSEREADDYDETIQLMEEILKTHKKSLTDREFYVITKAYHWISCIQTDVNGCFSYTRAMNLADGMLALKRYRSQVEDKLLEVCKWMPNVTIKEILLRHLEEFKKGPKPPKERVVIPYARNPSHMRELTIQKKKEMADIIAKEKEKKYGLHDHSKCIEEEEERYYPTFVHIGDWDPIAEGGIDLLYAPGRDSRKVHETFKAEYEQWREEFNVQDT